MKVEIEAEASKVKIRLHEAKIKAEVGFVPNADTETNGIMHKRIFPCQGIPSIWSQKKKVKAM